MAETITLRDLTDEEAALVKGLVEILRKRRGAHFPPAEDTETERQWGEAAAAAFAEDWDNEQDAIYNDWRERYGVSKG